MVTLDPTGRRVPATYSDAVPTPRNPEVNAAVLKTARKLFPNGFDAVGLLLVLTLMEINCHERPHKD